MMRRLAAAALLAALVLTGCSDDDDGDTKATSTTTAGETTEPTEDGNTVEGGDTAEDDDVVDTTDVPENGDTFPTTDADCTFLDPADLGDAFGTTFTVESASDTGCGFVDDTGQSVILTRLDIEIDPAIYASEAADTCRPETVQMVDAGDAAFACIVVSPTASVFEGAVSINLNVVTAPDEDAVVDDFAAVLPSVTFP